MQSTLYEVAIGMIPGIGSSHTRLLISYCGSAENVFKQPKGKLLKIPGIGAVLADSIVKQNVLVEAEKEVRRAETSGVQLLFYTHKNYPNRLKQINDAPTLLYYKGNADLNTSKILGVVGTRKATPYGKENVEKLLLEIKHLNPLIISGLAYGIDIAAHRLSIDNQLSTIGVMASGIDIIYPAAHKETANKMLQQGGLLTEYPFKSKPDAPHFPARNRIIAGLCDAIIVAEAAASGGALITAEIANSYNRDVFAIPGNIGNKYSEGCNLLIRNHKAHILTKSKDIEYIMNWSEENGKIASPKQEMDLSRFTEEEKGVLNVLKDIDGMQIDDLSWKSQVPMSKLSSILLNLEFEGIVKALPGKKFKLIES